MLLKGTDAGETFEECGLEGPNDLTVPAAAVPGDFSDLTESGILEHRGYGIWVGWGARVEMVVWVDWPM